MNFTLVLGILGRMLLGYAAVMAVPFMLAVFCQDNSQIAFLLTLSFTAVLGVLLSRLRHSVPERMRIRESFLIVAGAWVFMSLLGAFPFWLAGAVPSYVDALFEAVSGLTTTGSSVINNVEGLPLSLLLWRSLTQWLGGIGIIVLFIILLPNTGFGAVQLFNAEVSGPLSKRTMPRIRDTALTIGRIYLLLTASLIAFLWFAGMSFFDAVNHALSTVATGGFSTKNNSIMYYDSIALELILVLFIIISGGNYRIYLEVWKNRSLKPLKNGEFITYLLIILFSTLFIMGGLWLKHSNHPEYVLRHALFQVVSMVTGTGFVSTDYEVWPPFTKMLLFVLMFVGGCAGSTTGGMKVSRLMLLTKHTWSMLTRGLHPRAISSIKMDGRAIEAPAVKMVSIFFFLYIIIFALASLLLAATGLQPFEAMGSVAASLSNVGPGFGKVGPMTTYASITAWGKCVLSLCMLLGRLELFTLLIFLRPDFWRGKGNW